MSEATSTQLFILEHMNNTGAKMIKNEAHGYYYWDSNSNMNIPTTTANALIRKGFIGKDPVNNRYSITDLGRNAL